MIARRIRNDPFATYTIYKFYKCIFVYVALACDEYMFELNSVWSFRNDGVTVVLGRCLFVNYILVICNLYGQFIKTMCKTFYGIHRFFYITYLESFNIIHLQFDLMPFHSDAKLNNINKSQVLLGSFLDSMFPSYIRQIGHFSFKPVKSWEKYEHKNQFFLKKVLK